MRVRATGKIQTLYDPPPIPTKECDWRAYREDYEPGDCIGFGATEEAAKRDLLVEEGAYGDYENDSPERGEAWRDRICICGATDPWLPCERCEWRKECAA